MQCLQFTLQPLFLISHVLRSAFNLLGLSLPCQGRSGRIVTCPISIAGPTGAIIRAGRKLIVIVESCRSVEVALDRLAHPKAARTCFKVFLCRGHLCLTYFRRFPFQPLV